MSEKFEGKVELTSILCSLGHLGTNDCRNVPEFSTV